MNFLYDFSSTKITAKVLSNKYKKSKGRNKMWDLIQRDVRQKQKRKGGGSEPSYVMYIDRDRAAGVTMGASDLTSDLRKKKKEDKCGANQETLDWDIYFNEGLSNMAHGKFENALINFNKECCISFCYALV